MAVKTMANCIICGKPTMPKSIYCHRCHRLVTSHHREMLKRRAALQTAYSKALDAFICHYSGLPLDTTDLSSPFFLEFDHRIPIRSSDLVASGAVFNELKNDLTEDEYHMAIFLLDKSRLAFQYWSRIATPATGPSNPDLLRGETPTKNCIICGLKSYPNSVYCPRCRQFTKWGTEPIARRQALLASYNKRKDAFICYYTGVKLNDSDPNDPWYVSFDRTVPRTQGNLVVAALWITIMKEDLSRDEFYAVIKEQEKVFETGKVFDKGVAEFKFWNRKTRQERLYPENRPNARHSSFGAVRISSRGQRQ
jgi:hypothetical protein